MEQPTTSTSEAAPCVVCGTTGGYVPPGLTRPYRARRACSSCYSHHRDHGRLGELERVSIDSHLFMSRLLAGEVEPDEGGCIIWPGSVPGGDYPRVRRGGYDVQVSHVVLEAFVGLAPSPDHVAAHAPHEECGSRSCVNIDHLRWATEDENVDDRDADATTARGERQGSAKLTEAAVREIREVYATGEVTQREIGERYGVSQGCVSMICSGDRWAHA